MISRLHYIHGKPTPSVGGEVLPMFSPVSGELRGEMASGLVADAEVAVASGRVAFGEWAGVDPSDRGKVLWNMADALEDAKEKLAEEDADDVGKPVLDTIEDVFAAAKLLRFYAGLPDKVHGSTMRVQQGFEAWTVREPYGVIAAIVPWNYPIYNACAKAGGIIAMGNACVLKPAEQAPSSALTLARLAVEAGLPAGVLNVLLGDATAGHALAHSVGVDKVSFTGSTEAGRSVMAAAANSNLKPCSLELGGKSPQIVFADADLDLAAEASAFSNFFNQGQTCTAATRILVERSVADTFTEKLKERAERIVVGSPRDEAAQLGPIASAEQLSKVMGYVQRGLDAGARLVTGGRRLGERGYFFQPTVFADVDPASALAQEEIFGPVASVIVFDDEAGAVSLANSVAYGLAASIWTRDIARMHRMVGAVKAGIVWGNCLFAEHPSVPVGGYGISGYGKEYGLDAGYEYTRAKSVWQNLTGDVLRWTGVQF